MKLKPASALEYVLSLFHGIASMTPALVGVGVSDARELDLRSLLCALKSQRSLTCTAILHTIVAVTKLRKKVDRKNRYSSWSTAPSPGTGFTTGATSSLLIVFMASTHCFCAVVMVALPSFLALILLNSLTTTPTKSCIAKKEPTNIQAMK